MRVMEVAALVARIFRDLRQRPSVPARAGNTSDLFKPSV